MPAPMPPPGIAASLFFSGICVMTASGLGRNDAVDAAFCHAPPPTRFSPPRPCPAPRTLAAPILSARRPLVPRPAPDNPPPAHPSAAPLPQPLPIVVGWWALGLRAQLFDATLNCR